MIDVIIDESFDLDYAESRFCNFLNDKGEYMPCGKKLRYNYNISHEPLNCPTLFPIIEEQKKEEKNMTKFKNGLINKIKEQIKQLNDFLLELNGDIERYRKENNYEAFHDVSYISAIHGYAGIKIQLDTPGGSFDDTDIFDIMRYIERTYGEFDQIIVKDSIIIGNYYINPGERSQGRYV